MYFDPTSYTVNEADRTVTLTIQSSKGHSIPNGTVEFYTEDGTASGELHSSMLRKKCMHSYQSLYNVNIIHSLKLS